MSAVEKIKAAAAELNRPNPHRGSSLDDFLQKEGLLEKCEVGALKHVAALQLEDKKKRRKFRHQSER